MKSTQVSYLTSKHISIARGLVLQKFAIRTVMACLISFQVITRMNILVAVLCLIMGRPYQFYYFVPLVTFWFVVVYAVMALWPRVTAARVKGEYDFSDQVLPEIILLSSLNWHQRFHCPAEQVFSWWKFSYHLWFQQQRKAGERKKFLPRGWVTVRVRGGKHGWLNKRLRACNVNSP